MTKGMWGGVRAAQQHSGKPTQTQSYKC